MRAGRFFASTTGALLFFPSKTWTGKDRMALVNAIAELERCGWAFEYASDDEIKLRCPFHGDEHASCSLNVEKLQFKCHAATCGQTGDLLSLLARMLQTTRAVVYADLAKRYDLEQVKVIEPDVIERAHQMIWQAGPLRKELYARGVTDDDIRRYRLGENAGRITIPVKNIGGDYVNVRRYLPGAPGAEKMRNTRNRSKVRLFPIEQLRYDEIVLCGGELKAIVSARVLNEHGIGAITATAGEGNWSHELTSAFAGKIVYVMMDVDKGGRDAAQKLCAILYQVAAQVRLVELPLDIDKYPHGDVNDFIGRENGELLPVIKASTPWTPPVAVIDPDEEPTETKFSDAVKSPNVGKRMRFGATVAAAAETSFIVPRKIVARCDKSQKCCSLCAVYPKDDPTFTVSPESPAVLEMVGVTKEGLDRAVRAAIGVPRQCESVAFDVSSHYDVEDVRVNPTLELTNRDSERTMQQALCVGCPAELNNSYEFVGRLYPHPKTQQATLLVAGSKATADALSQYEPRDLHRLRVFRPLEWTVEGLQAKLDDVYADLETNVTRIFMRRDLHLFVDLAYHSPLFVSVDGKATKGWVEVLILGDNGQGKTEVATNLMRHYGLGERYDCKNATSAGLLGGLQQLGSEWFVTWGAVPSNDKRLVVLEELKGASTEVIAHLTDARSSGVAELTKVKKRRTHSRTRVIALSNSRDGRNVNEYTFGVEAIQQLIGAPEDVRRFDAALIVASGEIDAHQLAQLVRKPPVIDHAYTSELCRELILWAWTRGADEVEFDDDARDLLSDVATQLSQTFIEAIPLVDRGTTRYKVARLAASLACRTFSCGLDELRARVRKCHVEYAAQMLTRVYSSPSFGYDAYARAARVTAHMIDHEAVKLYIERLPHPEEVRQQLTYADSIDLTDVQDWLGSSDRQEAQSFLSLLVRKRCLRRRGRHYEKTGEFIAWLKDLRVESKRPAHADEGRF